jgi:small subunit ribosomal protein S8
MNMTDPIADMLTRTRNAVAARHAFVLAPASKMKLAIARILKEEGYVSDFEIVKSESTKDKHAAPQQQIRMWLKYGGGKEPVISGLERVSKPGQRVYAGKDNLPPSKKRGAWVWGARFSAVSGRTQGRLVCLVSVVGP